jgi:hypothetical protein
VVSFLLRFEYAANGLEYLKRPVILGGTEPDHQ